MARSQTEDGNLFVQQMLRGQTNSGMSIRMVLGFFVFLSLTSSWRMATLASAEALNLIV